MPELTHDTAEDGFHEIQLSGKQLVFLFMAATVVFVMIFLCGVLVGRKLPARGDEQVDQIAAVPAPEVAATEAPLDLAEPPTPPVEDELTYHKRLEGPTPPERLKPQPRAPEPKAEAKPTPAPPQSPPSDIGASAAATPPLNVPTAGRPGRWVVQVTALQNRNAAAEVVQRLIGKGYPAFVLPPAAGTPPLYRIQIGRYNDRSEAEQVARRLAREEQFKPDIKR